MQRHQMEVNFWQVGMVGHGPIDVGLLAGTTVIKENKPNSFCKIGALDRGIRVWNYRQVV